MAGCIIGLARTTPVAWARALGTVYVEIFRNIPLLVQMFLWYFVMPELIPKTWDDWLKQDMPNLLTLPFEAQFSLWEFTAQSRQISEYTFKTFEAFTAATLIYIAITMTVIFAMRRLESSVAVPGYISPGSGH